MENNSHKCIKCKTEYVSTDEEPYLCPECLIVKEEIAKSIDSQYSTVGQKPNSDYQRYAEIQQRTGVKFVNIKDLDNSNASN